MIGFFTSSSGLVYPWRRQSESKLSLVSTSSELVFAWRCLKYFARAPRGVFCRPLGNLALSMCMRMALPRKRDCACGSVLK